MSDKKPEKISVVAECTVSFANGHFVVKSFDRAWHLMREIALTDAPVNCRFNGFVRKDS